MDPLFDAACRSGVCDALGIWTAALLTILVFTYLIRDTVLFRLASGLLVGTAIGFVSAIVIRTVVWDQMVAPLLADAPNTFANTWLLLLVVVFLCAPLFLKLTPSWGGSTLSNLPLAYLFGIGAALSISGALGGALVPQLAATIIPLRGDTPALVNSVFIVVGTLGALLAFRFVRAGDRPWQRTLNLVLDGWGRIGRAFIMVAFGALLASLLVARVSALVGQLSFLIYDWLAPLFQ
jgi:hypothetical protein